MSSKKAHQKQIADEIRESIKKTQDDYGYSTTDKAFEHWGVELITGLENQDAFEAAKIGGRNDKGVDGFVMEIEDDHTTRIFQMKYTDADPTKAKFGPKAVKELVGSLPWLSTTDLKKIKNMDLRSAAVDFRRGQERNYGVQFILVIFGHLSPEGKKQFKMDQAQLEKKGYELLLYDYTGISEAYFIWQSRQSEDRVEDKVRIRIVSGQCFNRSLLTPKRNHTSTLVAAVPASEIVKLYEKYWFKLFDLNVRYSLGTTDASTAMGKTLEKKYERPLFFAYNNGMTILCDDYKESKKGDSVSVTAPQIVNGCQTTVSLHKNRINIDDNVAILVRFINSKTEELSQQIAESTNTQNAVTHRDLRANDRVQKIIQQRFENLSPPIKYLRKRGEWKKLSTNEKRVYHISRSKYRKIENEDLAKSYLAFIGKPIEARTKGKQMFVIRGGFYNEVFNRGTSAEEYLLPQRIFEFVNEEKAKFRTGFEKAMADPSKLTAAQTKRWLAQSVILYASYTLVGMMGHLILTHYKQKRISSVYDKKVASRVLADFDNAASGLYRICSKATQQYTNALLTAQPDYNLSNAHKVPSTFDDLVASLDMELGSDPSLTGFLP